MNRIIRGALTYIWIYVIALYTGSVLFALYIGISAGQKLPNLPDVFTGAFLFGLYGLLIFGIPGLLWATMVTFAFFRYDRIHIPLTLAISIVSALIFPAWLAVLNNPLTSLIIQFTIISIIASIVACLSARVLIFRNYLQFEEDSAEQDAAANP